MPSTKKVLFFAEAVTLAHIARCLRLAELLHTTGRYEIILAFDERYDSILGPIPYPRHSIYSVSSNYFFKKLKAGLPIYTASTLERYVRDDLHAIQKYKPDFIFGDFRLSLAISCKLEKVPYATITNAYWSPHAIIDYPVPEIPLTKITGVKIAQKLFDWFRPFIFAIHAIAFNKVYKKTGFLPLPYDLRKIYTHADYTLYADIESIVPMKSLPDNHLFIGPVLWSAKVPLPDWWEELPSNKPVIFISMGSSGDSNLLPTLLDTLAEMQVTVICATANKSKLKSKNKNIFITDFLPAEEAVKKADMVICNGGSPMVYQALIKNKAIIGIPGNLDQYLMMSIVKAASKGHYIRSGKLTKKTIQSIVNLAFSTSEKRYLDDINLQNFAIDIEKIETIIQSA